MLYLYRIRFVQHCLYTYGQKQVIAALHTLFNYTVEYFFICFCLLELDIVSYHIFFTLQKHFFRNRLILLLLLIPNFSLPLSLSAYYYSFVFPEHRTLGSVSYILYRYMNCRKISFSSIFPERNAYADNFELVLELTQHQKNTSNSRFVSTSDE